MKVWLWSSALAVMLIPAVANAAAVDCNNPSNATDPACQEGGENKGPPFPLHLTTGISNSVGGSVLTTGAIGGYVVPEWFTSIPINMFLNLPEVEFLPPMRVTAGTGVSIGWLSTPESGNGGAGDRIPRVGDFRLGLGFGNFLNGPLIPGQDWSAVTLTVNSSIRLPVSIASRTQNTIIGAGVGARFGWSSMPLTGKKLPPIFVSYAINAGGTAYGETSASIPCDTPPDFNVGLFGTGDPANDTLGIPLRIPRAREILPNGECRLVGRQALAGIGQGVSVGTMLGRAHSLGASFSHSLNFLRPIAGDGVSSPFASKQNFMESTSGAVFYTYDIPDDVLGISDYMNTNLTLSLSSAQPAWTFDGKALRFPWWDFISPNNNFSSLGVSLGAIF